MAELSHLLRQIPKVDVLLAHLAAVPELENTAHAAVMDAVHQVVDALRSGILDGSVDTVPLPEKLVRRIVEAVREKSAYSLRSVINATGIILHTNLGRAVLPRAVAEHVCAVSMEYSTLEYDVPQGRRGSRHRHIEELLCRLTGCEAAMAVNNNAAAVLLILSALCAGKEVIVSRGELVEIGGSFRIPDIMEQGGAVLREVGTTNRTRVGDYRAAAGESTAALLKVHRSNFQVVGFTEEAGLEELAALGRELRLPVLYDLGSGVLRMPGVPRCTDEPTVQDCLEAGMDIVSLSSDKLLGGPQAGIILGKREWIEVVARHPLARALRLDKLTLSALEATLRLYLDPQRACREIPTLAMLTMPLDEIEARAQALCRLLAEAAGNGFQFAVERTESRSGGGSLPGRDLPSRAVAVRPVRMTVEALERSLRAWEIPIIARVSRDCLLMDCRTVEERHFSAIRAAFTQLAGSA